MKGNTISIKGNIIRDAEIQQTNGGRYAAKWGIAWNSARMNQNGDWEDVPHFFDVKCWLTEGQLRQVEGQLVKGAACAIIDGHIVQEKWQTQGGENRSKVTVMVDDPIGGLLLAAKAGGARGAAPAKPEPSSSLYDEDIPF